MADLPRQCRECNVLLDDSNTYPSQVKQYAHICKDCQLRIGHEYRAKRASNDPVLYRCKKLLNGARTRARKRNREFSLTLDDLLELAKQPSCPISQRPFVWRSFVSDQTTKRAHPDAPSLDRIDSSRGYTPDNVWLISHRMNTIKSDATPEELKLVSDAVFLKLMENYLDSL